MKIIPIAAFFAFSMVLPVAAQEARPTAASVVPVAEVWAKSFCQWRWQGYDQDQSLRLAAEEMVGVLLNVYGYDQAMAFLDQYQSRIASELRVAVREACPESL